MKLFYLVFGVMCATCILSAVVYIYLLRYFRYRHPKIWLTFGFRGGGVWVEAQDEVSNLVAQRRFRKFLKSRARLKLQDATLNGVVSLTRAVNIAALLLFALTIALWLVSRTSGACLMIASMPNPSFQPTSNGVAVVVG
jgi:hypothetical protein